MEPMVWAGLIIASMAGVTVFSYKATGSAKIAKGVLAGASIAWIIFTYSAFYKPSAALYQFVLIACAVFGIKKAVDWFWSLDKEKRVLEEALKNGLPASVIKVVVQDVKPNKLIKDEGHVEAMYKAITEAKRVLVISSGWASTSVVNDKFTSAIRSALLRGVNVTLIWGWEGSQSNVKPSYQNQEASTTLKQLQSETRGEDCGQLYLRTATQGNHAKVILVDDAYAVIGSYNFLSNSGAEKLELSVRCDEPNAIKETKQYFRDCIHPWEINQL